ncbi:MAG: hypothetical protein ACRDZ7_18675 [Acidimicrobiia bacterium]
MRQRLLVGAVLILLASQASVPASGLESAPVTGVRIERTVTAVVTVHPDGRAPEVSEPAGFERRLQPFVATISEGPVPVAPAGAEPIGVFGCNGRGREPGYRDLSAAAGPVRLGVGDGAGAVFHLYSLAGGRTVDGPGTLQVLVCMAGGARSGEGRRLLQAGVGAAYDDTEVTHLIGRRWLDAATPARGEDGYLFSGSADAGADGWVEQEPAGWLEGSPLGPFGSDFDDYGRNATAGWWKHPCVDDGPVCGPTDGSTVFQGSLAGALWEFSDDTTVDRRFRVVLFLAEACLNPSACL